MKHVDFYAFAAAAAMILAAGCSKESPKRDDPDSDELTFSAVNVDTKSYLSEGTKVMFKANDAISLFSTNNVNKKLVTLDGTEEGSATFIGSGKKGDDAYYAVYPYTESTTLSGSKITGFSVPVNQTATIGTFAPDASLTFAKTTSTTLQFHNLCSILQVKIPDEDLDKIEITVTGTGVAVAGAVDIESLSGGGALKPASGNTNLKVSLSGATMKAGNVYYIAIIPGTYATLSLVGSEGGISVVTLNRTTSFTFVKGKIYDLNTVFVMDGTNDNFEKGGDFEWN